MDKEEDYMDPKDRKKFDGAVAGGFIMPKEPVDMVNNPPHYNSHPSGIECIDVVEHFNFNVGGAIKYAWRHNDKGTPIQDLKKAVWLLNREVNRLEKIQGN